MQIPVVYEPLIQVLPLSHAAIFFHEVLFRKGLHLHSA